MEYGLKRLVLEGLQAGDELWRLGELEGESGSGGVFLYEDVAVEAVAVFAQVGEGGDGGRVSCPRGSLGGCQSTVRVKVVVCEGDPDVAVSVTVELLVLGAAEDPLPQPLSRLSPTKLIAISNSI